MCPQFLNAKNNFFVRGASNVFSSNWFLAGKTNVGRFTRSDVGIEELWHLTHHQSTAVTSQTCGAAFPSLENQNMVHFFNNPMHTPQQRLEAARSKYNNTAATSRLGTFCKPKSSANSAAVGGGPTVAVVPEIESTGGRMSCASEQVAGGSWGQSWSGAGCGGHLNEMQYKVLVTFGPVGRFFGQR
jgi:hypothetical protein